MMNPMYMQNVMQKASQMMQQFQNPQMLLQQIMPGIPQEIRNDPNQIISWLQQNGKITDQQIRMAQQMMNRR